MDSISFHFVGDAFVDLFCYLQQDWPEAGGDARLKDAVRQLAGGSAVNTATHMLALLDEEPSPPQLILHTSWNAEDPYGRILKDHMERHKLESVNYNKGTDSTGHCVVMVAHGDRSFITHTGCIGKFLAQDLDLNRLAATTHPHIHIAGYYNIPGFWNGQLHHVLDQIRKERPSTTVSLVPQHDATGEWDGKILQLVYSHLDFLIMNDLEANYITKQPQNAETAQENWAVFFNNFQKENEPVRRNTWIIVTRGEQGAVAIRDGKIQAIQPAVQVSVIDPTGSGDCFSAAFLYGLFKWKEANTVENDDWPVAAIQAGLMWGCGAATCGTLTRGASVPSAKVDIQDFVERTAALRK